MATNLDTAPKVLVVDDDDLIRMVLRAMFQEIGFEVVEAANGLEGLEVFSKEKPNIIFTDLQMPEMNGLTFIVRIKDKNPDIPIIAISGAGTVSDAIKAIRMGAWNYVTKPVVTAELEIVTQQAFERVRLIAENRSYQEYLEELVMERTMKLRDSEVRFRTLFESANDAIILIRDEEIISCNQKTLDLFGCTHEGIVGRTMLSFSPLRQSCGVFSDEAHRQRMGNAFSGNPQFYEWRYIRHNGVAFDAEISLNRLELQGTLHFQAIMRDITERKRAEVTFLDNIRIKRELEIAQEIQQSLLPARPPQLSGLQVASRCVPATNVGGDYYDFFPLGAGIFDVVIADVAGHGFGSALLMVEARSVLHTKVSMKHSPRKVLTTISNVLYEDLSKAELQISMFYARLDLHARTVAYANAGHTRPLLFHASDGSFEELDAEGMLMGITREVYIEEKNGTVETGDILLFYTDGITDAEDADQEFFGAGRLCEVIGELRDRHPEEIMQAIFAKLAAFVGEKPLADDISIAILKIVEP